METPIPDSLSQDTFYNGRIVVHQYRRGYRFSIDAVLLAHHARPPDHSAVMDLGTGCGIIPLLLTHRNPTLNVTGVEIQPELADLAVCNVERNRMNGRIDIVTRDMRELGHPCPSDRFDMVVCNPPYRKADAGRINPDNQKAIARHEIKITLAEIVAIAAGLLKPGGKLVMICTAARLADLVSQMRGAGLEPKWMRLIHSSLAAEAKMVLLGGVKGGRPGISIDAPLILYHDDGTYTAEVLDMIKG